MKFGVALGIGPQVQIDLEAIQRVEAAGFDSLWAGEAWGSDAITPLAYVAGHTSRIKLGTSIMQMSARTPAMAAMQAMTVDKLSGGRMIVGLGPSGPQVIEGWHGQPYGKPLTRTREYINIMRQIFARQDRVQFEGECYQIPYTGEGASGLGKPLRSILHGRPDIPIYTAAISPKGVATAAQVADGVIPLWVTPEGLDGFAADIESGFAKAEGEKGWDDFDVQPSVNVIVGDDLQACRDKLRPQLALYVGGMGARSKNFYNNLVSRQGWPDAAKEIQDLYLGGQRNEAMAAVPDDLIDAVALVGPKERVRDRLDAWRDSRATGLVFSGSPDSIEAVAEIAL
ncbi:MAG: LLM class F420-dependent oxidoreductase [Gammaproteobacteria bacterium]|nr:LLM class F420-dependent oxidoreductase [Gammaproteobacteria bacterium]